MGEPSLISCGNECFTLPDGALLMLLASAFLERRSSGRVFHPSGELEVTLAIRLQ
jgi:hypothetical protein